MSNTHTLNECLRQAIADSGLSHYALAKRAGISHMIVNRFARGERDMLLATAGKVARALGLTLTENTCRNNADTC